MNPSWRRYLGFWGVRVEHDVDDELTFHIDMLVRDYVARGMSPDEARRAAEHRLGNLLGTRSACLTIGHRRQRRMARAQTIDALQQDVRYALRTLGRAKGWTTVALLTLALGIGASTAMFSVLNTLVINPLPYPGADRVATIWRAAPDGGVMLTASGPMLEAWRKSAHSIEVFEAYSYHPVAVAGNTDAVQMIAATIQPDFPTFAGEPLAAGRTFTQDETRTGGPHVVILGEGVARDRFGTARNSIGKTMTVDDAPYTVVGVATSSMRLPDPSRPRPQLWLPLIPDSSAFSSPMVVRVRKGTTFAAAGAELDSIVARRGLAEKFGKGFVTRMFRPSEFVNFRSALYLLSAAVALLLVVACANVAHLSLARGATRARELAIRAALGAGRTRLLRQLLTESLLLALVGGLLGVAIASTALKILVAVKPARLGQLSVVSVDSTVLWISFGLAALTGLAFGLTAAIDSVRRTTSDSLRNTALAGTASKHTHRLRSLLVVTEMAVSAMLLVTASLLVRSVILLRSTDPGFRVENLYSMRVELADKRYDAPGKRALLAEFMKRARNIPGVLSVTNVYALPPSAGIGFGDLEAEGIASPVSRGTLDESPVDESFFATVGIPLVQGSAFTAGAAERQELIINRGFAERVWRGESAVGKRVRTSGAHPGNWMTIVGVVGDVARNSLRGNRSSPMLYTPIDPKDSPPSVIGVRVRPGYDPTKALRGVSKSLDPRLPPPQVTTAASALAETMATDAFTMLLLAVFAGLAVILSAIGLYGVISYVVTQRTREIGIRIALGATSRNIATSIVARGLVLSAIGLVIGLVVSFWATRLIRSTLYGVSSGDALSFGMTAFVLLGVSAIACLRPSARAMTIDPAIAMRGD